MTDPLRMKYQEHGSLVDRSKYYEQDREFQENFQDTTWNKYTHKWSESMGVIET